MQTCMQWQQFVLLRDFICSLLFFCSLSETYLTVKGAALMLSSSNCLRTAGSGESEQSEGSRKYTCFSNWNLNQLKHLCTIHYIFTKRACSFNSGMIVLLYRKKSSFCHKFIICVYMEVCAYSLFDRWYTQTLILYVWSASAVRYNQTREFYVLCFSPIACSFCFILQHDMLKNSYFGHCRPPSVYGYYWFSDRRDVLPLETMYCDLWSVSQLDWLCSHYSHNTRVDQ